MGVDDAAQDERPDESDRGFVIHVSARLGPWVFHEAVWIGVLSALLALVLLAYGNTSLAVGLIGSGASVAAVVYAAKAIQASALVQIAAAKHRRIDCLGDIAERVAILPRHVGGGERELFELRRSLLRIDLDTADALALQPLLKCRELAAIRHPNPDGWNASFVPFAAAVRSATQEAFDEIMERLRELGRIG